MPVYEYACDPCRVVYQVRHGMSEPPLKDCPTCGEGVRRVFSPPRLNLDNFSSPTAARYARMSPREEVAREQELQKDYQTVWLPPPVKHAPWEEH
jgi:putative FmdB family regulatory protein